MLKRRVVACRGRWFWTWGRPREVGLVYGVCAHAIYISQDHLGGHDAGMTTAASSAA